MKNKKNMEANNKILLNGIMENMFAVTDVADWILVDVVHCNRGRNFIQGHYIHKLHSICICIAHSKIAKIPFILFYSRNNYKILYVFLI